MSDLINRQDAIDALVDCTVFKNLRILKSETPTTKGNTFADGVRESIDAIENLPSAQKGEWIKRGYWSEGCGMGEEFGHYWECSRCHKEVKNGYEICDYGYWHPMDEWKAWMPLPEPYKEEGDKDV